MAQSTTRTSAQLLGDIASSQAKGKLIAAVIGDSRFENSFQDQSTVDSTRINVSNQGALGWLTSLSKQRIQVTFANTKAVSGATTSSIRGQVANVTSILPKPTICFINGGTNSLGVGTLAQAEQSFLDITGAAEDLLLDGIVPVIEVDTPRTVASWSANAQLTSSVYNQKLRDWASFNGVLLADHEAAYIDDATGDPQAGYNVADGIHQSCTGAVVRANTLLNTIEPLLQDYTIGMSNPIDVYNATLNPNGNLLTVGLMTGTGGSNLGTGASGTVPTGWTNRIISGTATAVSSKESPRTDNKIGDRMVITLDATTATSYRLNANNIDTSIFTTGDRVRASCDIEITSLSGTVEEVKAYLFDFDGGAVGSESVAMKQTFGAGLNPLPLVPLQRNTGNGNLLETLDCTLLTEEVEISEGITSTTLILRIEIQAGAGSSLVVKVGDVNVRKVN